LYFLSDIKTGNFKQSSKFSIFYKDRTHLFLESKFN